MPLPALISSSGSVAISTRIATSSTKASLISKVRSVPRHQCRRRGLQVDVRWCIGLGITHRKGAKDAKTLLPKLRVLCGTILLNFYIFTAMAALHRHNN
ncbi:MAG: hypothetical protein HF975_10975 [ANME-2 cluster archaeon]|nr:hypothetical protein [ANME-2 cluster archaeon]